MIYAGVQQNGTSLQQMLILHWRSPSHKTFTAAKWKNMAWRSTFSYL